MTATPFNQRTIDAFRASQGRGVGGWGDALVLLTTRSPSGREITTPVMSIEDGGDRVVVASKGGAPENPRWYDNLDANPVVDVEAAGEGGIDAYRARANLIPSGPERERLFARMVEVAPGFAEYQRRTVRTIPVVRLTREG